MGLSFTPKSEEDLNSLLKPGEYEFEVLHAEHAKSKKSGADMIKIKLGVFRSDGSQAHIYDYLMPSVEFKLRHFCDSTGLLPQYQSGSLQASDCHGRSGKCKLIIKEDTTGNGYPPKNEIKDYVLRKAKPITAASERKPETPEDDVPF